MKSIFKKIIVTIITLEARLVLHKYKPKIVGVTGSVGKTSTKDAVAYVLSTEYKVRKSQKSFNSEIGIPLTILGLSNAWNNPWKWLVAMVEGFFTWLFPHPYPEVLVLEIGADRPGDIESVSKWIHPDVVVFTKVGDLPVHVEFFEDAKAVLREKAHLVKALKKTGTLIYCNDDEGVKYVGENWSGVSVSFGFENGSHFLAEEPTFTYDENGELTGQTFKVNYQDKVVPVTVRNSVGIQHVYPLTAALAVGDTMRINMIPMLEKLSEYTTAPGRMRVLKGIKHSTLIDDTYNASPIAVREALRTLSKVNTKGKRIAVLGDMLELGKHSNDAHKNMGTLIPSCADILVGIGVRSNGYVEGAMNAEMSEKKIYHFDDSDMAGRFLQGIIDPYDIVLLKGSQSIRVEKAVLEVMAEPERAGELLVRQEGEWSRR